MNIYVIIVGALLVVLLVAFGNNPVENAKRAKARAMQGKDPLVAAIEEHNKKPNGFGMLGGDSLGSASPTYPRYTPPANPYQPPQPYPQNQNTNSYYPPAAPGVAPSPLQPPRQPQS